MKTPLIAIVGKSNSGKTTLIEKLLPRLIHKGLSVATIKHDAHSIDIDTPGKDTWRHREAGASAVVISSDKRLFLMERLAQPLSLYSIAEKYLDGRYDLLLAEGFKRENVPKIEVHRTARSPELLFGDGDKLLLAVVSDGEWPEAAVPVIHLNDIDAVVDLILRQRNLQLSSHQADGDPVCAGGHTTV